MKDASLQAVGYVRHGLDNAVVKEQWAVLEWHEDLKKSGARGV